MNIRNIKRAALLAAGIGLLAGWASAQAGRGVGRIGGICTDVDGALLANIKIQIIFSQNENLKFDTVTNSKGEWSFLGLGTGNWNMTAFGTGYEPVSQGLYVSQLAVNPKVTIKMKKAVKGGGGFIQDEASFAFLEKGNQLFKDQKYDEAIGQFQQFIDKNPQAYQVRLSIGDCYREKGDYEKATAIYNEIIERSKMDAAMGKEMTAKGLAGLGNIMVKQNKMDAAQDYFKQSIASSPKDEILAYNVGEIYFSNQGLDEALKYFELASQIKPDWPDPYYKLGLVYVNKADNANAIVNLKKYLSFQPEGVNAETAKNLLNFLKH